MRRKFPQREPTRWVLAIPLSKHVGFPKDRIAISVRVLDIKSVETEFGAIGIHEMVTPDGDILIWKASSKSQWLETGKDYRVRATIKDHHKSEDGRLSTSISHVRQAEEEPPRVPFVAVGLRGRR